jgi:catechol 2,3-dioxygenase-like lactoylglutathione lyase family enzyme
MARVLGFGGFFFRARDPQALSKWYAEHLGIDPVPTGADTPPWMAEGGPTIFAPFPDDTTYFADDKVFMLNFRVPDLDALIGSLTDAGIETSAVQVMEGVGRFTHLHDPEGTPIELWEPAAPPG